MRRGGEDTVRAQEQGAGRLMVGQGEEWEHKSGAPRAVSLRTPQRLELLQTPDTLAGHSEPTAQSARPLPWWGCSGALFERTSRSRLL